LATHVRLIRSVVERNLELSGYGVPVAEDGRRALEIAETHSTPVHILLSHLEIPEMNGVSEAGTAFPSGRQSDSDVGSL